MAPTKKTSKSNAVSKMSTMRVNKESTGPPKFSTPRVANRALRAYNVINDISPIRKLCTFTEEEDRTEQTAADVVQNDQPSTSTNVFKEPVVQSRFLMTKSKGRRFQVSLNEIKRRIKYDVIAPDTLKSLLGGNFDLDSLPEDVRRMMTAPEYKQKKPYVSMFTSLLESEATELAVHFNNITLKRFPINAVVESFKRSLGEAQSAEVAQIKRDVASARRLMDRLACVMGNIRFPIGHYEPPESADPLQSDVELYSAITHGFGLLNMRTWLHVFALLFENMDARIAMPFAMAAVDMHPEEPGRVLEFNRGFAVLPHNSN